MRLNYAARKKFPVPTALTVLTNFISVVCAFKVVSSTLSREYDLIFGNLGIEESEVVTNVTGCLKPCHFKKYIFLGDRTPSSFKSEHYIFSMWAVSSKIKHTCKKRGIAGIYPRNFFWIFRKILGLERKISTAPKPSPKVAPSKMEVAPF